VLASLCDVTLMLPVPPPSPSPLERLAVLPDGTIQHTLPHPGAVPLLLTRGPQAALVLQVLGAQAQLAGAVEAAALLDVQGPWDLPLGRGLLADLLASAVPVGKALPALVPGRYSVLMGPGGLVVRVRVGLGAASGTGVCFSTCRVADKLFAVPAALPAALHAGV
jgi:hypothetical protein